MDGSHQVRVRAVKPQAAMTEGFRVHVLHDITHPEDSQSLCDGDCRSGGNTDSIKHYLQTSSCTI